MMNAPIGEVEEALANLHSNISFLDKSPQCGNMEVQFTNDNMAEEYLGKYKEVKTKKN